LNKVSQDTKFGKILNGTSNVNTYLTVIFKLCEDSFVYIFQSALATCFLKTVTATQTTGDKWVYKLDYENQQNYNRLHLMEGYLSSISRPFHFTHILREILTDRCQSLLVYFPPSICLIQWQEHIVQWS